MFTFVRDHLGSVRAVVDLDGQAVCEESDYFTYGGKIPGCSATQLFDSRWGYSGKEGQSTIAGLPYLDYGARLYDTRTCRWLSPDPLAEKYRSTTPYGFCVGDPVNYCDAQGDSIIVKDIATMEAIYNGMKEGANINLDFRNGVLDPNSIPDYTGDFFLDDLKEVASDMKTVEMETASLYSFIIVSTGEEDKRKFDTPYDADDADIPNYKEICEILDYPFGTHIQGDLGRSLFPNSTESISVDGKIHVIINSNGTLNHRTVGVAHEFGHVLLYLNGLPYQHRQTKESDRFIYDRASAMSKRLGYDY